MDEIIGDDIKKGDSIPFFTLIRKMSLHDPNWGKPKNPLKMEKNVSAYRREMFPEETEA